MEAPFADRQAGFVLDVFLNLTHEFLARAIEHRYAFATMNAQNMPGMMRLAARQEQSRFLALLGWQIETMHGEWGDWVLECWEAGAGMPLRGLCGRLAAPQYSMTPCFRCVQWNRFFAFSKKPWLKGLSLPLQSAANSSSFAFWSDDRWVGTSTSTRTCKSPRP
jgi:hypothetical protein